MHRRLRTSLISPALAVLLVIAATVGGWANGSPGPQASATAEGATTDAIIDRILHRNPGLRSYSAQTRIDVRQVNFPYLHPVLQGTEYYTSPGVAVFDFPHAPGYLKGLTKVESTAYSVNRWQRCYDIGVSDQSSQAILHMVPKIRGEVSDVYVTVSKPDYELAHIEWFYHNPGDHVSLWQTYGNVQGYSVLTAQQSDITLHHIRAKGSSSFWDFQFNLPVPTPTPTPSDPLHQCDN